MKQQLPHKIFVTGTGTGVGKTIAAAVLAAALQGAYWKPVQCGNMEHTDTDTVKALAEVDVFPEQYKLKTPSSPHYAAQFEGVKIELDKFEIPATGKYLVVEGAGGLMVPLNGEQLIIDFIAHYNLPLVLVAQHYLGGINHTLLSLQALKQKGINVLGIIYNGRPFLDNEEIIEHFAQVKTIGHIAQAGQVNKEFVQQQAAVLKQSLLQHFEI